MCTCILKKERTMAIVNKLVSYGFLTIILTVAGCATSESSKPEPALASPEISKPAPSRGEGQRTATGESTAGQSSLDDLQKGKPSAPGPLKDIYFSFDRY